MPESKVSIDTIASYVVTAVVQLKAEKQNARYYKFGTAIVTIAGEEKEFEWEVKIARIKVGATREWASRVLVRCGNDRAARDLKSKLSKKKIFPDTSEPHGNDFYIKETAN